MKEYFRRRWEESIAADVEERPEDVPRDLPYALQSKMFDQLATVSLGGAGLTVTLIGSLLRDAPAGVWVAVALFVTSAMVAISGNSKLIDGLFRRQPILQRSKIHVAVCVAMIGLAIGILSMSVYLEGKFSDAPAVSGGQTSEAERR